MPNTIALLGAGSNPNGQLTVTPAHAGIHAALKITTLLDAGAWIAPAILVHFLHPWKSQVRHDDLIKIDSHSSPIGLLAS